MTRRARWLRAGARTAALLTYALGAGAGGAGAQLSEDAFADPVARALFVSAQSSWAAVDESIARYTAVIRQRIAAAIRTPLKDRIVYRNETAVRAFWDREHDAVIQVLGTRSQYPGRSIAMRDGDLDWLDDLPFDEPFDPGADRLFFGLSGGGDVDDPDRGDEGVDAEFWFAHPLAVGADSLYRYESGDTLTLSLPDGRRLLTVQLDVLPRVADVHRITGTLWIEPESGALVRAVYRLSEQFDAIRDVAELRQQEEEGSFRYVPGLFKPWTLDLTMIAVDYGLWDFEVWLPRSMRLEAEAAAGIVKIPVTMDVAYRMESVTTERDLAQRTAEPAGLVERHFESRSEAMAFIARLLSEQEGIAYESAEDDGFARDRRSLMLAPEDRASVATSPHLPPPIWEDAAGFPSDEELEEFVGKLADLPAPTIEGLPWAASWGWSRPDLLRYNRVEGPSVGGRLEASIGGPWTVSGSGFFGFADLEPKVRLDLERTSVRRRLSVGAYRELVATDPRGGHLGFGNSLSALFLGRDEGEYYRATGGDFTWRPPVGARESYELRAYAERQDPVSSETDFAVFHAFDSGWDFRPNVAADRVEELGGEIRLSPWWGGDPLATQLGLELYGQAARWRSTSDPAVTDYARTSAVLRLAAPIVYPSWRLGMEVGAGTTWGSAPLQRDWFLGGTTTLRGYRASAASGSSFARGRLEIARTYDVGTLSLFGDVGWAGRRGEVDANDLLYAVGVGGSLLDGLVRLDLSQGLTRPFNQFRVDLYLDGLL